MRLAQQLLALALLGDGIGAVPNGRGGYRPHRALRARKPYRHSAGWDPVKADVYREQRRARKAREWVRQHKALGLKVSR